MVNGAGFELRILIRLGIEDSHYRKSVPFVHLGIRPYTNKIDGKGGFEPPTNRFKVCYSTN
jgi:hypothetical protein